MFYAYSQSKRIKQAINMSSFTNLKPVKVIAVTGGKGGVGKTNVAVNLSIALCQQGFKTLLLDADLGLANVDVMLGISTTKNISHVLNGDCELQDIVLTGPHGLKIVPAASGIKNMAQLSLMEHAGIIQAFSQLASKLDFLIVDTAAGITDMVVSFARASQDIVTVVCDEPTSITDAYALIKVLNKDHRIEKFHVLANMVQTSKQGRELFTTLSGVCNRFLNVTLNYLGSIPFDDNLRKSVKKQKPVVDGFPRSGAAIAIKTLAKKVQQWPIPQDASGQIEFFMERLVTRAS